MRVHCFVMRISNIIFRILALFNIDWKIPCRFGVGTLSHPDTSTSGGLKARATMLRMFALTVLERLAKCPPQAQRI